MKDKRRPHWECPADEDCNSGPWTYYNRHRMRMPRHSPNWRLHHQSVRPLSLFTRLLAFFGFFAVVIIVLIAGAAFLFSQQHGMMMHNPWTFVGRAFLLLAGIILVARFGRKGMQRFATPLSDLMRAAEAVAKGDLSVRVTPRGWGPVRQMCESFNRMVAELDRQDQQRKNLTADVAHELRTPLHIIQGNLEGILDHVYEPDEAHINATLEETRQLSRLVEDLRTLSRAEAGELSLIMEDVNVSELLRDIQTSFSGPAEVGGVDLQVHIHSPESELCINGDVGRLDQILSNLIANALRYTPQGGEISLHAQREGQHVILHVIDTGSGIGEEDMPFIFDRFWKGDRSRTRGTGSGSGLGLAIVQQLVRAHQGTISVQSETSGENHGTTFILVFPACG